MTGLFDEFERHFVVLTNFIENEVNSRPIGQEAGFPGEGPGDSGAGPGAQRSGWSPGAGRAAA